ncbi:MAG: lipoprotein-releasing ABC transporter permease subunit [Chromatiales bacterium]|jgi:lipoprotein-releasing system permease protein|nr:lipoprotein-releasing ABC transporter permease subunit [Chromatiales bacterium]MDX9767232.1 lipoprotein-releasing ABC transporter permease subunit [Ectothiorhodospiraceae bacterium]
MFRPLELYVGLRYTRAKRRNHFISFISLISMLGIMLGATALITVLSVMNGFEQELRTRILGMASHATVSGYNGRLAGWDTLKGEVEANRRVVGVAPYVQAEGMLSASGEVSGALIRGVLPALEAEVSTVGEHMPLGSMEALVGGGFGVVLGRELAATLNVTLGDRVTLVTPQANVTPVGVLPRLRRLEVVGIFEVGMYEYDRGTAFLHLDDARLLYQLGDEVSGLRLKLDDLFEAPRVAAELGRDLGSNYWISDWTRQHANFFRAVRTEKTVMFIILSLIVAVAAFNIVSTLVMVVTDKQADIAILRTLGVTPGQVMLIFIVQGTVIGLVGTLLGVIGGVTLALNVETVVPLIERMIGTKFLSPDVYYISELPSQLDAADVARVGVLAFALTVLATVYPAWRASRTQPAEALRYE